MKNNNAKNEMEKKIKIDRRQFSNFGYIFTSWFMLIFGLLIMGLSTYIYIKPVQKIDWDTMKKDSMISCEETARKKGFKVVSNINMGTLDMKLLNIKNPTLSFAESENILLRCGDFKLHSFCMGDKLDCDINGIKMVLKYQKPMLPIYKKQ